MSESRHTILSFEASSVEPGSVELHLIHASGTEARIMLPPAEVERLMREFSFACIEAFNKLGATELERAAIADTLALLEQPRQ